MSLRLDLLRPRGLHERLSEARIRKDGSAALLTGPLYNRILEVKQLGRERRRVKTHASKLRPLPLNKSVVIFHRQPL